MKGVRLKLHCDVKHVMCYKVGLHPGTVTLLLLTEGLRRSLEIDGWRVSG